MLQSNVQIVDLQFLQYFVSEHGTNVVTLASPKQRWLIQYLVAIKPWTSLSKPIQIVLLLEFQLLALTQVLPFNCFPMN